MLRSVSTEHFHLGNLPLQKLVYLKSAISMWGQQRRKQTCDLLCSSTYFHFNISDTPTQASQLTTRSQCFNSGSAPVPKLQINLTFVDAVLIGNETSECYLHASGTLDQTKMNK